MRILAVAALLLLALVPPPAAASHAGVHISELLPSPDAGQREFIELWNDGSDVDLTGWTISDGASTPNTYTFGAVTLPAGGRIVVWGGGEPDARGPAWTKATVWNNDGDQAVLADASGTVVDVLAYGSAAWPDGRSDPVPSAPPAGRSLALRDDAWSEASPTPGTVAVEQGGALGATVENVAPTVAFDALPEQVEPGATFTVGFTVGDANGDADVQAWRLLGDGVLLENGTAAGAHSVSLGAPVDRDMWTLRLEADDAAAATGNTTGTITVRSAGLTVIVAAEGVHFPSFPPGATEVLADTTFTMRNDGDGPVTPRIDISDLQGPATIPLAGRLQLGYEGTTTPWTVYDGPLTSLPPLDPGTSVEVRLKLTDLPTPLAAGSYGTSFAVVQ